MDPQLDIVIGCVTDLDFDTLRPWINSLEKCGFSGRKAMIVYNTDVATVRALEALDFMIYGPGTRNHDGGYFYQDNLRERIVVIRFFHIWQLLRSLSHLNLRYCIATDVRDLIFQTDPSEYLARNLGSCDINVGSESLAFADEPWGNRNMRDSFGPEIHDMMSPRPIYNAGAIGGRTSAMADLCLNIYLIAKSSPEQYSDQAALNVLLSLNPYRHITKLNTSEDGWLCQAHTTANPDAVAAYAPKLLGPMPYFDGSFVYTRRGAKFCLVHQYDRVPEWNRAITNRYWDSSEP